MSFYDILYISNHQHSCHILLHRNSIYVMNWDIALWQPQPQPPPSLLNYDTMKSTTEIGHAILAPPFKQKKKKKKKNKKREIQINQVCPPTYQAKISNVWFTDSNKFSKKSHTLRHHLFFSIKMHHLNIAIRIESITTTSHCEKKSPVCKLGEGGGRD